MKCQDNMQGSGSTLLKTKPQRYKCPHCKWDFAHRKNRCCPGCSTLLLIASDLLSDAELTALRSFWMWEPLKKKWIYVRDWEEHKQEAGRKFQEYARSRGISGSEVEEMRRPLTKWIQ